uniref:DUF4219 domain-containing protein n=1 Tax=Lotus japonicus TaxID=34305 RepID=I3SS73_LOTJA|nr:unknown [Lotus japonicus]
MAAKFEIPKFSGSNFSLWKLKIKAILRKDNCLPEIDGRPDDTTYDKRKEMDDNAVTNLPLEWQIQFCRVLQKRKQQRRPGILSSKCTRSSHFTTEFS